ncbi:hypothetical protein Prudu_001888, partial [Prunus dulcis]
NSNDRNRTKFRFGIRVGSCACPTLGECRAQLTHLPFELYFDLDSCRKFGRVSPVSVTQSQPEPQTGRIQGTVVNLIRNPGTHGSGVP